MEAKQHVRLIIFRIKDGPETLLMNVKLAGREVWTLAGGTQRPQEDTVSAGVRLIKKQAGIRLDTEFAMLVPMQRVLGSPQNRIRVRFIFSELRGSRAWGSPTEVPTWDERSWTSKEHGG